MVLCSQTKVTRYLAFPKPKTMQVYSCKTQIIVIMGMTLSKSHLHQPSQRLLSEFLHFCLLFFVILQPNEQFGCFLGPTHLFGSDNLGNCSLYYWFAILHLGVCFKLGFPFKPQTKGANSDLKKHIQLGMFLLQFPFKTQAKRDSDKKRQFWRFRGSHPGSLRWTTRCHVYGPGSMWVTTATPCMAPRRSRRLSFLR